MLNLLWIKGFRFWLELCVWVMSTSEISMISLGKACFWKTLILWNRDFSCWHVYNFVEHLGKVIAYSTSWGILRKILIISSEILAQYWYFQLALYEERQVPLMNMYLVLFASAGVGSLIKSDGGISNIGCVCMWVAMNYLKYVCSKKLVLYKNMKFWELIFSFCDVLGMPCNFDCMRKNFWTCLVRCWKFLLEWYPFVT